MSTPGPTPILQATAAPYTGPASYDAKLFDGLAVGEGVWIQSTFAKYASIEVAGSFATLSLQLLGSNSPGDPVNAYSVTIGGSVTTADVVSLAFNNPNLPAGLETVSYTTKGGDTTALVAAGLAAAINADDLLSAVGIIASVAASVITVTYPSGASMAQEDGSPTLPENQNTTLVTFSKSGGATETGAIANASVGSSLGAAITAAGLTAISIPTKWVKAVVNTLTVPVGNIVANYHGAA